MELWDGRVDLFGGFIRILREGGEGRGERGGGGGWSDMSCVYLASSCEDISTTATKITLVLLLLA